MLEGWGIQNSSVLLRCNSRSLPGETGWHKSRICYKLTSQRKCVIAKYLLEYRTTLFMCLHIGSLSASRGGDGRGGEGRERVVVVVVVCNVYVFIQTSLGAF